MKSQTLSLLNSLYTVTPGGAADSVRRLSKAVRVWIWGGMSSPDRSQAGPAEQGAEAGAGLWHHREGLCAFGCHSSGGQVGHRGEREREGEGKDLKAVRQKRRLMIHEAVFKVLSWLTRAKKIHLSSDRWLTTNSKTVCFLFFYSSLCYDTKCFCPLTK